ncbi:hypothetical protein NPX13_g7635 [Xylaria arbuscula]|uniref:Uncharacterized protein n=1 Tax=Xylaria arbuscula TaxID=114810 RepID=A0A9W8TL01_9PEZI|nr:hypothetical protein NPX13_g7635 [Xylaria arbuscula]
MGAVTPASGCTGTDVDAMCTPFKYYMTPFNGDVRKAPQAATIKLSKVNKVISKNPVEFETAIAIHKEIKGRRIRTEVITLY